VTKYSAIRPTIATLRSHFISHAHYSPAPIRHPESLAFKTRFKGHYTAAAVLIPVIPGPTGLEILLTERAHHLRQHPGQISFPGGRQEATDISLENTALRESHEEIGLDAKKVQVLGRLGDYYTVSGYQVTPVIGIVEEAFQPQLDKEEVCRLLSVPLDFLMTRDNFTLQETLYDNEIRHYYSATYENNEIWGVTAGIIVALYEALAASHLD